MYIRHVTLEDHAAILGLARQAGFGMTSLPPDAEVLHQKITKAVASVAGDPVMQGKESFLFVLVDPEDDNVVGTSGIKSHVGTDQPFYSYKLSTITQFCQSMNIRSPQQVLHVVNDYDGASEIGSLFLSAAYRRDRIGRFLSRLRFLFIAEFRSFFDERVISEIRGTHDEDGNSPFYDSIARHFFQMDFHQADYTNATQGNQFISDLMPKNPIYVNLLPKASQATIGKPYVESAAAVAMLEREGFRYHSYLDVFDGGPTLEVRADDIRTVRESQRATVRNIVRQHESVMEKHMMCTTDLAQFRAVMAPMEIVGDGTEVIITADSAELLAIQPGQLLRYAKA
ncbi:MAG: arginine N-succinyltransferase [Rickettsiales bacterium]|nr:arginine N-succinyltransferase [Rickettsiales bacterium]